MNLVYFLLFLGILNLVAFATFGIDKYLAVNKHRRISEKTLLRLAVFGGSVGAMAGRSVFRHKTQKFKGVFRGIVVVHAGLLCAAAWTMVN
ncbi:MAG: hypothetical protein JU82_08760 [Sulfuricurvum sp. MLSB]|uniref:DUF1294 domain-containing protein n=1 Tax=unclassified Sulfuricurvum TaxID=2632390 RepID=UPI0005060865|nr:MULTISPECIES: DUF1294 domain-containing protein [unclassified Sulfuricurvum]KFN39044.1 MAG: hypothetical protein JU82_08760 [Sulfuricurvum sp. MLSB]